MLHRGLDLGWVRASKVAVRGWVAWRRGRVVCRVVARGFSLADVAVGSKNVDWKSLEFN